MVRVKNRYLTVNLLYPAASPSKSTEALPELLHIHQPTPDEFGPGKLIHAVREGVGELFGDYGMGMVNTSLKVVYHSTATSTSIVRCPQAHYQMVWAALTFMTKLPKPIGIPVVVRVVRVSGTIKKAEEEVIRRARDIIVRAKMAEQGIAEGESMREIVKAVERGAGKQKEREVLAQMGMDEEGTSDAMSE
ncbi:hypothetical protein CC78DRAFT_581620 [Lojkania enalia]|uniref:Ribonuclease P/MRP protein subunit POP5 n=1 Tax=Lojkania enalia TaxID=147567 RepID=A0A9P4N7Z4_9PLEO|nr:hypothetical protein CC78DRAFT_581620 [Didymosphaeria enalia]